MWIEVDRAAPCSMLIWRRSRICLTSPAERPIHPHRRIGNIKRCLGPSRTGISARHDKSRKKFPHLNPFPKGEAEEANATALFFLDSWIPAFLISTSRKRKMPSRKRGTAFFSRCAAKTELCVTVESFSGLWFLSIPKSSRHIQWMIN